MLRAALLQMGFITPWGHAPAAAAAPALRQHCCCLLPSLGNWIRQQQAFHAAACRDTAAGTLRAQSRCTAVRSGTWPSTHHCSGPRHPLGGHTLPSTRQALLPLHQLTAAQHTQAYRQRDADFQGSGSDHLLEYQSPPLDMEQGQPQVPGSATPTVPIEDQELLQVGIVGAPNAGKSTLTNALVGVKVTATSNKTNTTHRVALGAFTQGTKQVALYDTPGIVSPRQYRDMGHEANVKSAWSTAGNCDMIMFIVDAHRQVVQPDPRVTRLVEELSNSLKREAELPEGDQIPAVLVLNKVDMLRMEGRSGMKEQALRLCEQFNAMHKFEGSFWVSATRASGVQKLKDDLLSRCTPGEWTLSAHETTDLTVTQLAREVVREKIFRYTQQEVPYETRVQPISFKQLRSGDWRIEQDVLVPSEEVKKIIVGRGGVVISTIGKAARLDLQAMYRRPVHIILTVRVDKK